jgi:hypothetical protein
MTKMVVLTTFQDSAGADVAREAVADAGIPAELRRVGGDVYLGSMTGNSYELRVPEDRVHDAEGVLAALEEDMEQAAIAAAGVPIDYEDERGNAALPAVEDRPRKLSWAIAFALISPLPGLGVMYARQYLLGLAFAVTTLCLGMIRQFLDLTTTETYLLLLGLKVADLVLAPILTVRFNRKLEEKHAAQP